MPDILIDKKDTQSFYLGRRKIPDKKISMRIWKCPLEMFVTTEVAIFAYKGYKYGLRQMFVCFYLTCVQHDTQLTCYMNYKNIKTTISLGMKNTPSSIVLSLNADT